MKEFVTSENKSSLFRLITCLLCCISNDSCVENSQPVRYAYQHYMNQLLSNGLHQFYLRSLDFSPDICYAHTAKMMSDKHINIFADLASLLTLAADNDTVDKIPVVGDDGHSIDCCQTDAFDDRNIDCRIYFADDMVQDLFKCTQVLKKVITTLEKKCSYYDEAHHNIAPRLNVEREAKRPCPRRSSVAKEYSKSSII
uniref:Uncharacterized protein n=1 Tax=Glossina palpalis gambiensis TaxID=67801 RepID=A0A1B0BCN8_9MUSC